MLPEVLVPLLDVAEVLLVVVDVFEVVAAGFLYVGVVPFETVPELLDEEDVPLDTVAFLLVVLPVPRPLRTVVDVLEADVPETLFLSVPADLLRAVPSVFARGP